MGMLEVVILHCISGQWTLKIRLYYRGCLHLMKKIFDNGDQSMESLGGIRRNNCHDS
jgi:hypothetical protein